MTKNTLSYRFFLGALPVTILAAILMMACTASKDAKTPGKKTGTILNGTVKGMAFPKTGGAPQLDVELTVKLDDGTEIQASSMVDEPEASALKGKRVEVEPAADANKWKVVRILDKSKQ